MVGGKTNSKAFPDGESSEVLLWGRHSVIELLRANRWHPLELGISDDLPESVAREVRTWAKSNDCPVEVLMIARSRIARGRLTIKG